MNMILAQHAINNRKQSKCKTKKKKKMIKG